MFCKVEDPADIETVNNSVCSGSEIKEAKPTHRDDGNEAKAQKTSVARISPSAKLLITEYGLDLSSLKASGSHGTLLKGDVLAAIYHHIFVLIMLFVWLILTNLLTGLYCDCG